MKRKPVAMRKPLLYSFVDALDGLRRVYQTERNIRIQFTLGTGALLAGLLTGPPDTAWLELAQAVTLVWAAETINTALEAAVDRAGQGFHPLAKQAKHAAAGAVLITVMYALAVGTLVLWPRLTAAFAVWWQSGWPDPAAAWRHAWAQWADHPAVAGAVAILFGLSLLGWLWPIRERGET